MSWKPEVFVEGKWSRNGLVFATKEEAEANAKDLMWRWTMVQDSRAAESTDPVNYTYIGGELKAVQQEAST
ncbi:hypothetical protein [Mesorhizobium sp. M4B.F.Ca.ET.058.02.1.1]|uniref:hypothetical protein n=1 Tax=Mesorhizobium sp. M4B.F.Ca.ET.058.02.1.1 TaxID=2493675 RepID=UPI000F7508E4|nr:hypothetical protein [Mesorhizobium sp. M4B.F.Ca.ET.058.02.1.1]AZO48068.1 hypothetical protein EJ073_09745 [Mesorhizobium sp. M4B.F.Ca.ET.058.02.1.1]TJX62383.1 MAG: hypothetical protein E5W21_12155 [Mesorhizobium sp.]